MSAWGQMRRARRRAKGEVVRRQKPRGTPGIRSVSPAEIARRRKADRVARLARRVGRHRA